MIGNLSNQQLDILVGLMLGDGNLEYNGYRGTRLQVKQSEEKREYVFWLYDQFTNLTKTPPQQRKDTRQWYFGTRFYEDLEDFRKIFYSDRKKVLPANIADLIRSPLTLAVWFMDDGRLDFRVKSHYAYHISTDSFTESEVMLLQNVLLEKFGIAAKTYLSLCRGKRYPKLYIGKEGRDRFTELVAPYILPCFGYKIPPKSLQTYTLTPQRLHAELHS
jgi:recombination protein RecA